MDTPEQVEERSPAERIEEIFSAFETAGAVGPEKDVAYLFDLQGEDGGQFLLKVGASGVQRAEAGSADVDLSVKLSVDDFLAIADGNFDGRLAVASERIEFDGDMSAAESLLSWIEAATHPEE